MEWQAPLGSQFCKMSAFGVEVIVHFVSYLDLKWEGTKKSVGHKKNVTQFTVGHAELRLWTRDSHRYISNPCHLHPSFSLSSIFLDAVMLGLSYVQTETFYPLTKDCPCPESLELSWY